MNRYDMIDQARYHLDRCGQGPATGGDHIWLANYLTELGAPEQLAETARRFGHDEVVFALYDGPERGGHGPGRRMVTDWLNDQRRALSSPSIADTLPGAGA